MQGRNTILGTVAVLALLAAVALAADRGDRAQDPFGEGSVSAELTAEAEAATHRKVQRALRLARRAHRLARTADQRGGLGVRKAREAMQKGRFALNKARKALNKGRTAFQTAHEALQQAEAALQAAKQAQVAAKAANDRLDAAEPVSDTAGGVVTTAEETDYVSLGGPEVTVTVPQSGLIDVWASVHFEDPANGMVALYEDGQRVVIEGQEGICGSDDIDDSLLTAQLGSGVEISLSTPPALLTFGGCGSPGAAPGPIQLERTPGEHTYELRYADDGCGCEPGPAGFSDRLLRIAPRP